MVMGYSISAGLQWGILTYLLVKIASGKSKEVNSVMWVRAFCSYSKWWFWTAWYN